MRMCTGGEMRAQDSRCQKVTAAVLLAQFSASLDFACLYGLVESSGCYTVRALFYE